MTPYQKLKHVILIKSIELGDIQPIEEQINSDNIDSLFDENNDDGYLQDAMQEIRSGEVETDIPAPYSRHYESNSVAMKTPDGSWIGWTYWYGGGKHGEPEAIDWMEEAYDLSCKEEEKVVIVRTFEKVEE